MTRRTLTAGQTKLEAYQKELEDAARSGIQKRTNQLRHAAALADSLSPYRVLGRGYAMVYDSKNRLCSADALSTGDGSPCAAQRIRQNVRSCPWRN